MSRNTVRRIIRKQDQSPDKSSSRHQDALPLIQEEFSRCEGNVVRVRENLLCDYGLDIPYSTITRLVRELSLREGKARKRVGSYNYKPGHEAQHDTSPHRVMLNDKKVTAQCAAFVLSYSRMLYIQYYPTFTRFEAKVFLDDALRFLDGSASQCIIDNTSVIVAHGHGPSAEMAPEMEAFGKMFGMRFSPHAIGHADRKAIVERNFSYVENNFLKGRKFRGWRDLNVRARKWCVSVANQKFKRSLGMSPQEAYIMEKRYLLPLPPYIPPVYKTLIRVVDMSGFVTVDTNRYSVPERLCGRKVEVHKTWERITVFAQNRKVADHSRLMDKRDAKIVARGHHGPAGGGIRVLAHKEEKGLLGHYESLDQYVAGLKRRCHGRGTRKIQRLLHLKRTYPGEAFEKAIKTALHYGLYDLSRLENMILACVAGDFFNLEHDEI